MYFYPKRDFRYGLPRFRAIKATCAMILLRQPVQYIHPEIWEMVNE